MGACERILRTPIPLSYTRHTSRFLTIWLALLPLAVRLGSVSHSLRRLGGIGGTPDAPTVPTQTNVRHHILTRARVCKVRPELGWLSVPFMAVLSILLLGVDEIGVQIEEPFRSLPLQSICGVIEASVVGYSAEHDKLNLFMPAADSGEVPAGAVEMEG